MKKFAIAVGFIVCALTIIWAVIMGFGFGMSYIALSLLRAIGVAQ